jgi:hypothetical protein
MRVAIVDEELPYPPNSGTRIRSTEIVRGQVGRGIGLEDCDPYKVGLEESEITPNGPRTGDAGCRIHPRATSGGLQ